MEQKAKYYGVNDNNKKLKIDIMSLSLIELEEHLLNLNEKPYRAKQIFSWLHSKTVKTFDEMTDLSKKLRDNLNYNFYICKTEIIKVLKSNKDNTEKYLLDLGNNTIIESVLMEYEHGYSICISSQSGCKMSCVFCASGLSGFHRNLTPAEMLNQIYEVQRNSNIKISNVVVMGIGEPLDNFENVLKFLKLINDQNGQNVGMRHITISTCGITNKIEELSNYNMQINLAISLHAPNNDIRLKIMPVSKPPNDFDTIIKQCKEYSNKTKRRITFEYALIKGVNDSVENARQLCSRLRGFMCHVNLIALNEVKEKKFAKSDNINIFMKTLNDSKIPCTIRRNLGSDIEGACGQLRNSYSTNFIV